MKKLILGEAHDIIRTMPSEQLGFFAKIRLNTDDWEIFKNYCKDQKFIHMDKIYRLRRPKSQDDLIKNQMDHEYYAGRIADLVLLLQICENASNELERRERSAKKK
jgi:hypothetical protein